MAGCARSEIVRCGEVGVYHCWARCVRRAFLCGTDPLTGRNYEHRRDWLHQLQGQLAGLFGVEIAFHAEMGNHAHLVLRTRPDVVQEWSDEDVVIRWLKIAKLKRGSQDGAWEPTAARVRQELADADRVRRFRKRLVSVSWFMGAVCENIARRANLEDHCRGAFWESRFSSRDLADESAILACGIYVDLNQIRAGEAVTPEESRHTSAYDRIEGLKARLFPSDQVGAAIDMVLRRDRWLCVLTLDERTESDEDRSITSRHSTIRLGRVDRLIGMCTFVTYTNKRLSGAKRWPAVREVRLCGVERWEFTIVGHAAFDGPFSVAPIL